MSDHKLDIFKVLSEIDKGNISFWQSLNDEEKKGFYPLIVMRWMSGTSDTAQTIALNEFANRLIFPLAKHPELLYKIFVACATKTRHRYQWIGGSKNIKNKLQAKILKEYFGYSSQEIQRMIVFPPNATYIQMAEELGWINADISALKKELKGT